MDENTVIEKIKNIENKIFTKEMSYEDYNKTKMLLEFMLNNLSRKNNFSESIIHLEKLINKIEKHQKTISSS